MANILSLYGECGCSYEPPFGDCLYSWTSGSQVKLLAWIATFGSVVLSFRFLVDDEGLIEIGPYRSIPQANGANDFQIHLLDRARFLRETRNAV